MFFKAFTTERRLRLPAELRSVRVISRTRRARSGTATLSVVAGTAVPEVGNRPREPGSLGSGERVDGLSQLAGWTRALRRSAESGAVSLLATMRYRLVASINHPAPDPSPGCLFCQQGDPSANHIVASNRTCFARLDNFPATPGHVEVVPKRHVVSLFELTQPELTDAYELLQLMQRYLLGEHQPDGFTVGVNEGRAAGRSIDHLHVHLIPRHYGDVEDPRGGIRQIVPNCDPATWSASRQQAVH